MGRPRKYVDDEERRQANKERQAAFRKRTYPVNRAELEQLRQRLDRLQVALDGAAGAGDEIAQRCRAGSHLTMLEQLAAHFEARG